MSRSVSVVMVHRALQCNGVAVLRLQPQQVLRRQVQQPERLACMWVVHQLSVTAVLLHLCACYWHLSCLGRITGHHYIRDTVLDRNRCCTADTKETTASRFCVVDSTSIFQDLSKGDDRSMYGKCSSVAQLMLNLIGCMLLSLPGSPILCKVSANMSLSQDHRSMCSVSPVIHTECIEIGQARSAACALHAHLTL